jgi:hypothetical protein
VEELLATSRRACPVSSCRRLLDFVCVCVAVRGGGRDRLFSEERFWKAKANVRTLSQQRPLTIAVGKRAATPRTASLICVGSSQGQRMAKK